jgi:hypothetical protein
MNFIKISAIANSFAKTEREGTKIRFQGLLTKSKRYILMERKSLYLELGKKYDHQQKNY